MKKLKLLFATVVLSITMGLTAYAGQWKQDTTGWWFQNDDGSYLLNGFAKIGSYWYYFDNNGYILTGWHQIGSDWYEFSDSGYCMNPSVLNDIPVGAPYRGWIDYSTGSYESMAQHIRNGRVVAYNGRYWCDPVIFQENIVSVVDVSKNKK